LILAGAGNADSSICGAAAPFVRSEHHSGIARLVRAVKILARDGRVPRWLRWLVAAGLLPVPGPVDEAALLVAALLLFARHPDAMRDAWRQAR
jgi:hypothetical protein